MHNTDYSLNVTIFNFVKCSLLFTAMYEKHLLYKRTLYGHYCLDYSHDQHSRVMSAKVLLTILHQTCKLQVDKVLLQQACNIMECLNELRECLEAYTVIAPELKGDKGPWAVGNPECLQSIHISLWAIITLPLNYIGMEFFHQTIHVGTLSPSSSLSIPLY